MKALIQRVQSASVRVNQELISDIKQGFLVLLGIEKNDTKHEADYLTCKILNLRIFEDSAGKMNLSISDIKGEILVVSQFTLAGNTEKGNRPSFTTAADPKTANALYQYFTNRLKESGLVVKNGIFQADMKVSLINDGPVTFLLEKSANPK